MFYKIPIDFFDVSIVSGCAYGALRLTGGDTNEEGRVEIPSYNNVWGTICIDGWTTDNSRVVCRQLEFSTTSRE